MYKDMDKSRLPLIECINVLEGSVNSLTDLEEGSGTIELVDYLKEFYHESSIFFDKDIESLFDYMYEAGFNDHQIMHMNDVVYGNYIEFIYYKDLELYFMIVGTR